MTHHALVAGCIVLAILALALISCGSPSASSAAAPQPDGAAARKASCAARVSDLAARAAQLEADVQLALCECGQTCGGTP